MVQALPNASARSLARLERTIASLPTPTRMLAEGRDADGILDALLEGLGGRERHRSAPSFHCDCNRDRISRAVALLGRQETRQIVERRESVEVRCEFCGEHYTLGPDEVGAMSPDA